MIQATLRGHWLVVVAASVLALPAAAAAIASNNAGSTGTSQFTQSSTSTLAFDSTVIVIYNDSGSFAGTGDQLTGYSRSTDGGSSFTDLGRLPTSLLGDAGSAHLARHNASGTVFSTALAFRGGGLQLFRSTDGGLSFTAPVDAAPGVTAANRNAIAVDNAAGPGNGNLYLATESFGAGGGLRFFRATEGGATFGGGLLLSGSASAGLGPSLAVAPNHRVTTAFLDTTGATPVIHVRSSSDGGLTFGAASIAATLSAPASGDLGLVGIRQGTTAAAGFRTLVAPQLSVNPVTGQLYMVYADNPEGADRADVFLRHSSDGGATWSAAQRINSDAGSNGQWQPALAVTPNGEHLGVFWYDRRLDAAGNNRIAYYGRQCDIVAAALDCDPDFAICNGDFLPEFGRDALLLGTYMGDFDDVSADNNFFSVSFAGNQDNLPGGNGRKDPNVYFARIAVIDTPSAVPEPATVWLLAIGLLALWRCALRRRNMTRVVAALSVATAAVAGAPAVAAPLPAAIVDATAQFGTFDPGKRIQDFDLPDHTITGVGTLQFFGTGAPAPAIRATADIGPTPVPAFRSGVVSGFLRYYFEIAGPAGSIDPVPVDVGVAGHDTGVAGDGGVFEVFARWSLRNTSEQRLRDDAANAFFGGVGGGATDEEVGFSENHAIMLLPNPEYPGRDGSPRAGQHRDQRYRLHRYGGFRRPGLLLRRWRRPGVLCLPFQRRHRQRAACRRSSRTGHARARGPGPRSHGCVQAQQTPPVCVRDRIGATHGRSSMNARSKVLADATAPWTNCYTH